MENYFVARERSLHPILHYALIGAGVQRGYVSTPEYKVRLKKPIDKLSLDQRFRQGPRKRKTLHLLLHYRISAILHARGEVLIQVV